MINSDNSYKRDEKDEDSKSEIDKKDKSFNTIDKEDFLPLLKPETQNTIPGDRSNIEN